MIGGTIIFLFVAFFFVFVLVGVGYLRCGVFGVRSKERNVGVFCMLL